MWDMLGYKTGQKVIFKHLTASAGVYVVIIFLVVYYFEFQIHLQCSCSPDRSSWHCGTYLALPTLIIFFMILFVDKHFRRILRFTCKCERECKLRGHFCAALFKFLFKAAATGLLWVASVLINGFWYTCCLNYSSRALTCKKSSELNLTEKATIADLKNDSEVFGLLVVLGIVGLLTLSVLPWNEFCCRKSSHRAQFEKNVLEQAEIHMEDKLERIAKAYVVQGAISDLESISEVTYEDETKQNVVVNIKKDWDKISDFALHLINSLSDESTGETTSEVLLGHLTTN